ncbi:hypothetical protein DL93DRAFT_2089091 [Clavulina sp. PMI_390]|nr:hypothetical protein DL93DRAFT_2089091 [Clavulina sp. PMI_390]
MAATADPSHVTFPDGDALIRSSDGVEFRVHSFMLRFGSRYFSNIPTLYPKPSSGTIPKSPEPIQVTEGSYVINTFLLLLYSSSSLPAPTYPLTAESRTELLLAAEKFKFTSTTIDRFFLEYLQTLEPLQSWAIAVRYGFQEARRKACSRVIMEAIDIRGVAKDVPELNDVSGRAIMQLQAIQEDTLKKCRKILHDITWGCPAHAEAVLASKLQKEARNKPLTATMWSHGGTVADIAMWAYHLGTNCTACADCYIDNSTNVKARIREMKGVVSAAAKNEALTGN